MSLSSKLTSSIQLSLSCVALSSLVVAGNIYAHKHYGKKAETLESIAVFESHIRSANLMSTRSSQKFNKQVSKGQTVVLNFRYGLDAVRDDLDLDGDGITNEAVCVDESGRPSFMCR